MIFSNAMVISADSLDIADKCFLCTLCRIVHQEPLSTAAVVLRIRSSFLTARWQDRNSHSPARFVFTIHDP